MDKKEFIKAIDRFNLIISPKQIYFLSFYNGWYPAYGIYLASYIENDKMYHIVANQRIDSNVVVHLEDGEIYATPEAAQKAAAEKNKNNEV